MKKFKLKVDILEYKTIIMASNEFRNDMLNKGRYVDSIDELLIKLYK